MFYDLMSWLRFRLFSRPVLASVKNYWSLSVDYSLSMPAMASPAPPWWLMLSVFLFAVPKLLPSDFAFFKSKSFRAFSSIITLVPALPTLFCSYRCWLLN